MNSQNLLIKENIMAIIAYPNHYIVHDVKNSPLSHSLFPLVPTDFKTDNPIQPYFTGLFLYPPNLLVVASNMQLLLHLLRQAVLLLRRLGRRRLLGLGVVDVLLWRLRVALVATGLKEKGCQL